MKKTLLFILLSIANIVSAQQWTTHFAYNNVTQIAMADECVYAISDGSLFSVDKQTEQIKVYNRQSGLHGSGINCIHYDNISEQLFIAYQAGKIDLLSKHGVKYIGELYDKDMTQEKTIYNVTIHKRTAYLSTAYGIQTFDLRTNRLVDSYWLRPNGQETHVQDILIANDSIYAFTTDSLFCAALTDNLVDYTVWKRELRSGRISPDADKGIHYQDAQNHWYAGHAEGIVRFTTTSRLTYKPQGPLVNVPYGLTAAHNRLWMVTGGRWANQFGLPGMIMMYDGAKWTNIPINAIKSRPTEPVYDFLNVAVDPKDANHYFVSSYGTGLYEFVGQKCVAHIISSSDNTMGSAVKGVDSLYTRIDKATFDSVGNLWILNAGSVPYPIVCLDTNKTWHGLPIFINNERRNLITPSGFVIDTFHPNYKWIANARVQVEIILIDDNGTPFDSSDDRAIARNNWTTQKGQLFTPETILSIIQDSKGRIWMATDQGIAIIDTIDYFTNDHCIRPEVMDNNGTNPMTSLRIEALCLDTKGQIWVGTQTMGVYVLNEDATSIIAQYTTDNSALPSNSILSIACDERGIVSIGTGEGLVQYNPNDHTLNTDWEENNQEELDKGTMQQWRLHLSYADPKEITASPHYIYAMANGSLFGVDRETDELVYHSKATGLNGTDITHIAYDPRAEKLIIAYSNGLIDLLEEDGTVTQIPDISIKAGSIPVTINCITVGSKYTYLGMPFGIIAINTSKAEVTDTYYIGDEASSIDIQQIVELGDSIYAFSYDRMYTAALHDNLIDYRIWHAIDIPCEKVQQAVGFNHQVYTLQHDSLYIYKQGAWQLVVPNKLDWIHASDNQLLTYQRGNGLLYLTDSNQLQNINSTYIAADAIYSNGEYWIAEEEKGLVRLSATNADFFHPTGPANNSGYQLDIAHNQLYIAHGGRWADPFGRLSNLSIYDGYNWRIIPWPDTWYYTGHAIQDVVKYAIDPQDPGHFFVATYGTGVFEFKDYKAIQHYDNSNSSLQRVNTSVDHNYFTRTDGATMDADGNLWVLNATAIGQPLHVRTKNGQWVGLDMYDNGQPIKLTTPGLIWIDQRDAQYKWIIDQREAPGVILFHDNGTPTYSGDDKSIKRNIFIDQDGKTIQSENIMCLTQDLDNRIWVGTNAGLFIIPAGVDFYTSNSCKRIIIPRNDGTNLGDYLLGNEQINCMAADGGNRMWIGTANSGLYLIQDDTITVAHFTETNSLLPSNNIQSIAIMPTTGEVFVGTAKGIASYRSDASAAQEDLSQAYAFPNPVRPNYGGAISIAGLMENTMVNIIDAGGNLVCKTRSHGGMAVWSGYLPDGTKAKSGVYTALCNEPNGASTVVKILVL